MVRREYLLKARSLELALGRQTRLMGVVNITPDSFSQDGCLRAGADFTAAALRQAQRLIRQGADIIDIGGESTRPGAPAVSVEEETRRVIPAIRALSRAQPGCLISVDTYKSAVARQALDAGAAIVNNIKGTHLNKGLLRMIARYDAAVVLMHMRGTPRTMQRLTDYGDLLAEIRRELENSRQICLENGIESARIILDPGIGFSKTAEQNLQILSGLGAFAQLGQPLLVGPSRKSFIGKILDNKPNQRGWGTAATVALAARHGAHIVRVHDVAAMRDVARVADAIINQGI